MEYYSVIKNEIMISDSKWMELKTIMLSKISQYPKNQRLNVLFDMRMLTHNKGGGRNRSSLE